MDVKIVKELIKAFEEANITSLSLDMGDGKIEMKKDPTITQSLTQPHHPEPNPSPSPAKADIDDETTTLIKSPIVGLAYRSPKPGEDPFVTVGQKIKSGQTLCLIEAMKMFNEIKATQSGIISEILFEDGQLVEFDAPLFKIDTK